MTKRRPPLRDPHLEEVAGWHPIEGSPEKVSARCAVEVTVITTYRPIRSGEPEGC